MFLYKYVIRNSQVNNPLRRVFEQYRFMHYRISRILHPVGVLKVTLTTQVLLDLTVQPLESTTHHEGHLAEDVTAREQRAFRWLTCFNRCVVTPVEVW